MTEVNPVFLGAAGFLSLVLAYLIFVKDAPIPVEPVDDRNPFSATEVVRSDQTTIMDYTPRHPPHSNANIPLIARVFNHSGNVTAETFEVPTSESHDQPQAGPSGVPRTPPTQTYTLPSMSRANSPSTSRLFTPSASGTRAASAPPSGGPSALRSSSLFFPSRGPSQAPSSGQTSREPSLAPSQSGSPSVRRGGALTRSSSRQRLEESSSSAAGRAASTPASQPRKQHQSAKIKANGNYLWLTNRRTRQCSKNKNFPNVLPDGTAPVTAYFRSSGDEILDQPPHEELVKRGLRIGDVHVHYAKTTRQIWIYLKGDDGTCAWESVDAGYVRSVDGRSLNMTPNGNPNFTGDGWASRKINEKINRELRKGKGKMVASESDDEGEVESQDE